MNSKIRRQKSIAIFSSPDDKIEVTAIVVVIRTATILTMSIFVILKIWCSILIAINDTAMQCTPDCIIALYI